MAFFSFLGTAIAGALFAGSTLAASVIAGGLAFAAKFGLSYLNRPKKRSYSAVQGETQFGGDVPVSTVYGTAKVKGQRTFYAKWGKGNKFNAEVFVLANGWCDGLEPYLYFYGEKQTLVARDIIGNEVAHFGVDGFVAGSTQLFSIRFYDGRPGQGVDQKLVNDTADLGQTWKTTSVNAGLTYVVVERMYNGDKFDKGKPDIEFVLRGLREYDPRKDSSVAGGSGPQRLDNPATWVHTLNPAVHRLNYQLGLRARVSGRTLIGEGKSLGQIDLATYFVAMNVCDTPRLDGKPLYQCSLVVGGEDDHTEILREFDDAMAGYGLNRRGLSGIIAGAPQIPVMEITAADIPTDRAKDVQFRKSAFERYNHMSGQFTSKEAMWNPESLKPIYVNLDVAEDGRIRQVSNDFLQVTDPDIAQYLINIRYRQNRKGGTATLPVSRRVGMKVQEGEWVTWRGRTWMITEWALDERFRVTLKLSETGADIYDDEDIEPGPIVIPPIKPVNPSLASTVQDFTVEVGLLANAAGEEVPTLLFRWTPPADPSITAVRIFFRAEGDPQELQCTCTEPEKGEFSTTDKVLSLTRYYARATITTVPDRLKTFTPWAVTLVATGRNQILDDAVTELKLADRAVSDLKIKLLAIKAELIANEAIIASKISNGAVTIAKFAGGIEPVSIIPGTTVPTTKTTEVVMVNGTLYRWNGTAYVADVDVENIKGVLKNAQIESVAASKVTGQLTNSQIADLAAAKLTGQVISSQIADAAVTNAKFAAGIKPVEVLATLPGIPHVAGRMVFLTTDGKLYRNTGSGWVASIAADDISGQVQAAQIAALEADKITGQITGTQITDNAISTIKLAAGAVIASKIAAGAVLAAAISAGAVTTDKLDALAVTADKLAANSVIAGKVAAGAISATEIAAKQISARHLVITDLQNLVQNGSFATGDTKGWSTPAAGYGVRARGSQGSAANTTMPAPFAGYVAQASGVFRWYPNEGDTIECKEGDQFLFSVEAARSGIVGDDVCQFRPLWVFPDGTTANNNNFWTGLLTSWTTYTFVATAPAGACGLRPSLQFNGNPDGYVLFTNFAVRRRNNAELIVDGAVVASKIAAGAIQTEKIAAGAVTAGELGAEAVTAVKVAAGAITTAKIAAGAVIASTIASGAVTTAKLDALAVTADKLAANSVIAGKVAAGAISATEIAAKEISARHLVITDLQNLVQNGSFATGDTKCWATPAAGYSVRARGSQGSAASGSMPAPFAGYIAQGSGVFRWFPNESDTIECREGDQFLFSVDAARSGTVGDGVCQFRPLWVFADGTTGNNNNFWTGLLTSWTTYTYVATAPAGAVGLRPSLQFNGNPDGYVLFTNFAVRRRNNAELIVDGAVIAEKIATNAVVTGKIAAGAITALELGAGSVTAVKIASGAVTAAKISVGSLVAISATLGAVNIQDAIVGTLTVGTSNLDFSAVTSWGRDDTGGYVDLTSGGAGTWQTLYSITLSNPNPNPAFVNIDYSIQAGHNGTGTGTHTTSLRIVRAGTTIFTRSISASSGDGLKTLSENVMFFDPDTVAGNRLYQVQALRANSNGNGSGKADAKTILLTWKR